ncbi:MAG: L-threonylcarbamoyladenylate synthase [Phycisphaerales bacterium]|jgi:L-threonylcarbamoyladenylate synthase
MDAIAHAAAHLGSGGLVAMPTETVYGLAAIARNADAVARVFKAKGRPATNPLIVHASTLEMARDCCADWPQPADVLARAFWPGPLTLVMPRASWVPDSVTAGGPTVAVRVPNHPVALALIEAAGEPLVAPSANRSGYVSPTTPEHVRSAFGKDVFVLDGGPCEVGIESTVLAIDGDAVRVLRLGVIGPEEIRVAGVPLREGERAGAGPVASPGLLGPHYQPRARVVLVETIEAVHAAIGDGPCVLLSPPGVPVAVDPPNASIAMPAEASAYARELYAALREADVMGAAVVVACVPEGGGSTFEAVRERLRRAAGA